MKKFSLLALAALAAGTAFAQTASLVKVEPAAPGSYYTPDYTSGLSVFFTPDEVGAITIDDAYVVYTPKGSEATETEQLPFAQDEYRPGHPFDVGNFEALYYVATQKAALGTEFTVVLENVMCNDEPVTTTDYTDNDYIKFEDGNILLTYKTLNQIFNLTSETWPSTYYAYWSATDASPIATLVFNENIASVGEIGYINARVEYGSEAGGGENSEYGDLDLGIVTIDGNTVTLDFSNVELVFRAGTTQITIFVLGVTSESGQRLSNPPTGHMSYVNNIGDVETGIESIETLNGEASYFNLQGLKVANPEKGQMLIKVQDGKASKVVFK